jgi:hypothetical protein
MQAQSAWKLDSFPIVYEGGEAKAVIVDVASFAKIELILDNLINREPEPEDAMLLASVGKLLSQARKNSPSPDWRQELETL